MERIRIYGGMMSLKEMSLRKVIVTLWCQSDILASLDICDVESKVEGNCGKLELPALLSQQMKYLVKPIGSEIRNWKQFHEVYLNIGNINVFYILEHLCWTMFATVDYRKTAERIIYHGLLDIVKRYRLACIYCLDEYIPILWEKLPEERKNYFYKEEGPLELTEPQLEFCWPYILKGEEWRLDYIPLNPFGERTIFNQYAFEYSAYKGNKTATEYFFRKLPCDVREYSLLRIAREVSTRRFDEFDDHFGSQIDNFPEENISDVFCYLTSLIDPVQQAEIFKDQTCEALICLLDWPWQDLFLAIAKLFWNFLEPFDFVLLLKTIGEKIKSGYHLTKLFHEFFLRGSTDFIREFVESESHSGTFLHSFFKVKDSETIKVIFRKLDPIDRKTLVTSWFVFKLFYKSISRGERHLVELCLDEATLSTEDKEELKETYFRFLPEIYSLDGFLPDVSLKEREHNWKQFLPFLD